MTVTTIDEQAPALPAPSAPNLERLSIGAPRRRLLPLGLVVMTSADAASFYAVFNHDETKFTWYMTVTVVAALTVLCLGLPAIAATEVVTARYRKRRPSWPVIAVLLAVWMGVGGLLLTLRLQTPSEPVAPTSDAYHQLGAAAIAPTTGSHTISLSEWATAALFLAIYLAGGAIAWCIAEREVHPAVKALRRHKAALQRSRAARSRLEREAELLEQEIRQHRDELTRDDDLHNSALARIEFARAAVHAYVRDLLAEACGDPADTNYVIRPTYPDGQPH